MKSFYLIWNPDANMPPRVRFETLEEAKKIAKEMVERHKAQFFVLKATSLAEPAPMPVKVTTLK